MSTETLEERQIKAAAQERLRNLRAEVEKARTWEEQLKREFYAAIAETKATGLLNVPEIAEACGYSDQRVYAILGRLEEP